MSHKFMNKGNKESQNITIDIINSFQYNAPAYWDLILETF